jgi:hypothetical protein
MGRGGCLLTGELTLPLHCLTLGIGLLSVGSRLLPHPKSMSSLEGEADVRLWCGCPRGNHHHGLSGRSILQPWCGCDGGRRNPHVGHPGDGEAGASL